MQRMAASIAARTLVVSGTAGGVRRVLRADAFWELRGAGALAFDLDPLEGLGGIVVV